MYQARVTSMMNPRGPFLPELLQIIVALLVMLTVVAVVAAAAAPADDAAASLVDVAAVTQPSDKNAGHIDEIERGP